MLRLDKTRGGKEIQVLAEIVPWASLTTKGGGNHNVERQPFPKAEEIPEKRGKYGNEDKIWGLFLQVMICSSPGQAQDWGVPWEPRPLELLPCCLPCREEEKEQEEKKKEEEEEISKDFPPM